MNRTESLPMVALRGMTILPEMVAHFDISRERSIEAVQEAMASDQKIFLLTHLVCMVCKEAIECVEVEFLPSATDGGEHAFTSGMGDQRAPLSVPLANLLLKLLFLRFEFGEFCLLFLDALLEILNGSHGSSFLLDGNPDQIVP